MVEKTKGRFVGTPLCVMVAVHQMLQSKGLSHVCWRVCCSQSVRCTWPRWPPNAALCSAIGLSMSRAGSQQLAVGTSFLSDFDLLKDLDGHLS